MPGSARCRALPAACHTLLLLPRSLHRVHSTPSRPGVCFVQRRTCALVAHLDTFLRSRSTQQEAAARYSTPPAAAASADAPIRVSASDVERLRGLPPAEWEAAASVVVREAQAKGVVASSFLKGVLETCPTYATAAAFAKRAGIGFVAASAQLAKVALAAGDRNGCEAVYRALLLDPAHSTTYHAGGQLDAICRELKRHGEHETLLAVLSLRQASRRQGTRVSGDTLCLAVEIATSYAQLHATLAKGHRWRARSGLLAQAVAEAGIRLAEPRVVDLALWVLEGDYGDPSAPFFYEDPAASQQETAAAVEPPTNEAAADAILADIEAATRARKKRVVAWSGAWGALLHLHAVLDDEKQALAVWKRIDDAGMSLDIACRRHLLHAAGHFLRSGAQEGSKEGQRSSKRGQWMHVVRAAKEGVSEHKRLMRLANSVASGKYRRPSETVKGPQRTAQRKVAASVDALSAIE